MNLTEKQIVEIAENLEMGMKCFHNLKTGELTALPDTNSWLADENELWGEEYKKVEGNLADYYEFKGLESRDSFRIMTDFTESVNKPIFQNKLIHALNKPNPFKNFKWLIDNSDEFRQQWFDFKKRYYINWVKLQIRLNENDIIDVSKGS